MSFLLVLVGYRMHTYDMCALKGTRLAYNNSWITNEFEKTIHVLWDYIKDITSVSRSSGWIYVSTFALHVSIWKERTLSCMRDIRGVNCGCSAASWTIWFNQRVNGNYIMQIKRCRYHVNFALMQGEVWCQRLVILYQLWNELWRTSVTVTLMTAHEMFRPSTWSISIRVTMLLMVSYFHGKRFFGNASLLIRLTSDQINEASGISTNYYLNLWLSWEHFLPLRIVSTISTFSLFSQTFHHWNWFYLKPWKNL